ncbi:Oxalate:formate antiporter [bacterium HR24]|nr:Oxalate:formate antiporter [bacterium HR24]
MRVKAPALPLRAPSYYGWWMALASMGALAVSSGVSFWSFGLYLEPLEREMGWSRSQLTGAISLTTAVSALMGPVVGWWVDRFGVRSAFLLGTIPTAISYFLLAGIGSLWQFYALMLAGAVVRTWLMNVPAQALVSRWFMWRRGQALSLANAGLGLGGFIFTPALVYIMETWGWRQAFAFSGLAVIGYFLPVALLLVKDSPGQLGVEEPPARPSTSPSRAAAGTVSYRLHEAVRTPVFWSIAGAQGLLYLAQLSFLIHAVPFLRSEGLSPGGAAALVSAITALYTVLRVAMGRVTDWVPPRMLGVGIATLQAMALGLVLWTTAPPALAVFVPVWALGQANGSVIEPLLIGRYFGVAHFGAVLGASGVISTMGFAIGPFLASALYDALGDYDAALLMFIGAFAAAGCCYLLVGPLGRRLQAREQGAASRGV